MAGGVLLLIFGIVYLMALCCGYRSLKIAIDVIDASADFLAKTKRIILVPIFYFFVTIIILFLWVPSVVALSTMAITKVEANPDQAQMKLITKTDDKKKTDLLWIIFVFMLFVLLWICQFIKAKNKFICMYSASTYYFSSNSE